MTLVKTPKDLGQRIRSRRRELRWDQARLAAEVGVSRQWIIDIEKGKPRAELGLTLRALHTLGLLLEVNDQTPRTPEDSSSNTSSVDPGFIDEIIGRSRAKTLNSASSLAKSYEQGETDIERITRELKETSSFAEKFGLGETDIQRITREMKEAPSFAEKFGLGETDIQRITREMKEASSFAEKFGLGESEIQRITREMNSPPFSVNQIEPPKAEIERIAKPSHPTNSSTLPASRTKTEKSRTETASSDPNPSPRKSSPRTRVTESKNRSPRARK